MIQHVPDNRMVKCVLAGYEECPALTPEACICYQMQQTPVPAPHHNMYDQRYVEKYGKDKT